MAPRLWVPLLGLLLWMTTAYAPPPLWAQPRKAPAHKTDADIQRARTLLLEGVQAFDKGQLKVALDKLQRANQVAPAPELAFNIARVYERMGDPDKAIQQFRSFLRRGTPTEAQRKDVQGRIKALTELKKRQRSQVFTAPPSRDELTAEARTFFSHGVEMFKRKRYEAAMEAFVAATRFADLKEIHFNMAVTSERMGRRSDAILHYRDYQRALEQGSPEWHRIGRKIDELRGRR